MEKKPTQGLARLRKWLIYTAIIVGVLALVWSQLPRSPYSTELTRIGQGQPAMVLAYDIQSLGGMAVMGMMDELRDEYSDRVVFLVAPLGAPMGEAFGRRFGADNGSVVLFSGNGAALSPVYTPQNTAELKDALDTLLAQSVK